MRKYNERACFVNEFVGISVLNKLGEFSISKKSAIFKFQWKLAQRSLIFIALVKKIWFDKFMGNLIVRSSVLSIWYFPYDFIHIPPSQWFNLRTVNLSVHRFILQLFLFHSCETRSNSTKFHNYYTYKINVLANSNSHHHRTVNRYQTFIQNKLHSQSCSNICSCVWKQLFLFVGIKRLKSISMAEIRGILFCAFSLCKIYWIFIGFRIGFECFVKYTTKSSNCSSHKCITWKWQGMENNNILVLYWRFHIINGLMIDSNGLLFVLFSHKEWFNEPDLVHKIWKLQHYLSNIPNILGINSIRI